MEQDFPKTICTVSDTEDVSFDLENWSRGIVICPKCSTPLDSKGKILGIHPCSNCNSPVFFPCRMKSYVLYSTLGIGGLGRVFLAVKKEVPDMKFAVKLSNHAFTGDKYALKTLIKEAETGLKLGKHPNIVEILDVNTSDNLVFVVMPLIEGRRLDRLITFAGTLSERKSLHIISQTIDAEMHISGKGFLYRDLKPENIIIETDGTVKLFDYGLTIRRGQAYSPENLVDSDDIEGSPYYIPPERVLGMPENESSEIYSMGMMLYHMLKGEPCFYSKKEIEDIVRSHIGERTLTVADELRQCNVKTIRLIDRMIARIPAMRYQNFQTLKQDVGNILSDVSATPTVVLKRSDILGNMKT